MDNNIEQPRNPQKRKLAILQKDEDGNESVPNWLIEVLAWITRIEMANTSLSYTCKLFYQLCSRKLHDQQPRRIERLVYGNGTIWYINSDSWENGEPKLLLNVDYQPLAILTVPPPPYLGFDSIIIDKFLDDQILEFVQHVVPRLNKINILLFGNWMDANFRRLLNLLANKIVNKLIFHYNWECVRIFEFNQLFPGFLQNVQCLYVGRLERIPANFDTLFDWLLMELPPPTNVQQKILQLVDQWNYVNEANEFIDRLKEEFSNAIAPRNFFITGPFDALAHFNMENLKTGEILTMTPQRNILRCLQGQENQWNEEGERKTSEPSWMMDEATDETKIQGITIFRITI